ncbi:DNA helicase [Tanacetum coccineum]
MTGIRGYELPTTDLHGGIVFEDGPISKTDFDVIFEFRGEPPQRINKLHQSYMSLQFPLLFVFGQPWFYPELQLKPRDGRGRGKKVTMTMYYRYQFRLDYIRTHQNDLRSDYLSGNVKWPEIKRYMAQYPELTPADKADVDPKGYKFVTELMMHGPCGAASPSAACMQEGSCSKHFSKTYSDRTFFDSNGHTHYRRRDTKVHVMKGESKLDHCDIVPYNRALCLAFEAHINVEYYGWSMLIKYLFKYISKGPDRILAKISNSDESTTATGNIPHIDEIQKYVNGRFICPYEACWRIFDFPILSREPVVQILNVHLENMQRFNFHFPSEFVWYANSKRWQRRQVRTKKSIGRLTYVHPSLGYLFYFRMLLCHRRGCKSPIEPPPQHLLRDLQNKLLMEEKNYKRGLLREEAAESAPKLNHDHRNIFDLIISAFTTNRQELLFVYGHGGTGKTSLWRTIISSLRSHGKIVLAVTSSGIVSLLLPAEHTTHSQFKLPLELTDESLCHAKNKSLLGNLLDTTLKDLMSALNVVFGGKTIVLGGDFCQTLLVKKGASKEELIVASIIESHLWPYFKVCMLKENMRILRSRLTSKQQHHSEQFAKWLLDVGNGELGKPDAKNEQDSSWVTIPPKYTVTVDEARISELIDFIYDDTTLKAPTT